MADSSGIQPPPPTIRRRRLVISTNILVQILAAVALVLMVNWLVWRHYVRWDWTKTSYYGLADKTQQVLHNLKTPVKVVVFLQPSAEHEYLEKVYQDVRNLLADFTYLGGKSFTVEYVDPQRDRARAEQLIEIYKVEVANVVIFASGERHKYVSLEDMVDFDTGGQFGQGTPKVKAFKAEGAFLAAIQSVTEEEPPKVYFLTGHGEHDPGSFDQRRGLSQLATYIKRDNITVDKWNLLAKQALPPDAKALVIAGPTRPYSKVELDALQKYLRSQGRLFVMLDPRTTTGLDSILAQWGVTVDNDLAVAKGGTLFGTELMIVDALGATYAQHPVTLKLQGINTSFPYARSLHAAPRPPEARPDAPKVTELIKTPPSFWGETELDDERTSFDADKDLRGPLCLAVAVETSKPPGVELEIGPTRMIVVGSSGFVDNSTITTVPGNVDFFMGSLNWLLQREQLIAVAPKTPQEFSLDMSPTQVRTVYFLTIGGLPLTVGIIGLIVWMRRRK